MLGSSTVAASPDDAHMRRMYQMFALSRFGSYAVKMCENRTKASLADDRCNGSFQTSKDTFETVTAALLLADPNTWFRLGNNGGVQTPASFKEFLTEANHLVATGRALL